MRTPLKCTVCGTELHNDTDTYGDVGGELCADCWYEMLEERDGVTYYGVAPHTHDFSITGGWIGSTVLLPLPEPAPDGRYWIEERQMWFMPDAEVDGAAGIWSER